MDDEKARAYMTHEQEIIEAEARGENKRKVSTAEIMIRNGEPISKIKDYSGATSEQIQAIADKIGIKLVE